MPRGFCDVCDCIIEDDAEVVADADIKGEVFCTFSKDEDDNCWRSSADGNNGDVPL